MRGTAYSGYIYGGGISKSQRQKKLSKRELIFYYIKIYYQIGQEPCEQRISVTIEFTLEYLVIFFI
jgi:hypothetical protein